LDILRRLARRATAPGGLGGIHPLLFTAYPVLFLWSQNLGETPLDDALEPLIWGVFFATLATMVLAIVFGDRARAALVVTPLAFGTLMYGHIAELTGGSQDVLVAIGVGISVLGALGAWRLGQGRIARLDRVLTTLGAILVGVSLISIVPYAVDEALAAPPPVLVGGEVLQSETDAPLRDVYWLVFDRYGSDRSLELQYEARNDLTPWLREQGFQVLENSHANYVATSLSMATTLNMAHLEELTGLVNSNSSSYAPVYARLQASRAVMQLKALGYTYHHLGSWWNPTRFDDAADENYNADGVNDFTAVLFETSALPLAIEALGWEEEVPSEHTKHIKHNTYALDELDRLRGAAGPKFVLAHILLPHPPYVYDSDGRPMTEAEAGALDPDDAGRRQLTYTNSRIRAFLEPLLALPEAERPIVILQADEGPWTDPYFADKVNYDWRTASPDELEIKFGILNAWYVPGGVDLGLEADQTAINTFPILFGRYFGLDGYELLPDRVTTSSGWNRPYRLIDVTDRLPSLNGAAARR
jgi:hypothetical protein